MTWSVNMSICNDCPKLNNCTEKKVHEAIYTVNGVPEMYSRYHGVTEITSCQTKQLEQAKANQGQSCCGQ